jgi:hypothetical protein
MKINKELYFKNLTGYKISNSHFELGSNLHISDYFYAKRLFYNSYYTNRFAFLITRYILQHFKELITKTLALDNQTINDKEKTITLIGYENYTELLVSNVRKMLNDYIKKTHPSISNDLFNHDIFTKDQVFLKNPDKISKNIISIFPISTTFSTSVRIQTEIRELLDDDIYQNKDIIFHNPIINCLVISNGSLETDTIFADNSIEYEFGWKNFSFQKMTIEMASLDDPAKELSQYFFINLPSKWEKINECKSCYPDEDFFEKCLIETKINQVTPNLIFSYPKSVIFQDDKNPFSLFNICTNEEPIVYRKHFKKLNNNFIYYIRAGVFLKQNLTEIKKWLITLIKDLGYLKDKKIVIITPTIASNSGFTNLVNEVLFSDTATIIQYNPSDDYLYNFKTFYSKTLEVADYIIFVDDILFTTNTFTEINYYIKNIKRKEKSNGIDLCLTLINRSGYYNFTKLQEEFDLPSDESLNYNSKILSFSEINVAPILHRKTFPFDKLTAKFENLSSKSVLDQMRIHFKKKEYYFKPLDLSTEFEKLKSYGTKKELFQFLILNEFNKIFRYDSLTNKYIDDILITAVFESGEVDSYKELEEKLRASSSIVDFLTANPEFNTEIKKAIFKICSSEPFIQFKNIRENVFKWVSSELIYIINKIKTTEEIGIEFFQAKLNDSPTKYAQYHDLKFLLKRGTKLKINFIYSIETLRAIEKVLRGIKKFKKVQYYKIAESHPETKNAELLLFDGKTAVKKISNIKLIENNEISKPIFTNGFITYYVGLLQELIIDHESKALQTVINVKEIIDSQIDIFSKNLKNTYNDDFMNLLRMLVLENTFIFHSSSEKFLKRTKNRVSLKNLNDSINLDQFKADLYNYTQTYSFGYTAKMLSRIVLNDNKKEFQDDEPMLNSFENMILLKAAIMTDKTDQGSSDFTVKEKIETILNYCCKILDIKNGGAFFAVKYKNKDVQLTNEDDFAIVGEYGSDLMKTSGINSESILYNCFNGIMEAESNQSLSCFEISYGNDEEFHFIKNNKINDQNVRTFCELENNRFRNLFYLRISQIQSTKDQKFEALPIAVLCFYDNIEIIEDYNFVRFDPKRVRQLLLLRNNLNDFINKQLDNDSLRAYIEEQNQMIINKAITHSFDTYVTQYTDTLSEIENLDVRQKFEILGTLILNKHLLLKFIAEYLKCGSASDTIKRLSITKISMNINKLTELLMTFQNVIFNMDLSEIDPIKIDQVSMQINIDPDINILWYDFFYKELIFELFYNIRKIYSDYIDVNDKFKIDVRIDVKDEQNYLIFTNNLYNFLPEFKPSILAIERVMYNRREKKGLSLINTISQIIYRKKCLIRQFEDKFQILIPIEINETNINY